MLKERPKCITFLAFIDVLLYPISYSLLLIYNNIIIANIMIDSIRLSTVFGWFQNSFAGIEREIPYNLFVGYIKGAELADARLMFNVMPKFGTASKQHFA